MKEDLEECGYGRGFVVDTTTAPSVAPGPSFDTLDARAEEFATSIVEYDAFFATLSSPVSTVSFDDLAGKS